MIEAALKQSADAEPRADTAPVSAIVVSYFTGPLLARCLDSAEADPGVGETIVVDNGNTPEEAARLRAWRDAAPTRRVLLQGHGNAGFARGCNLGVAEARCAHVLFLNPDALLKAGSALALVEAVSHAPAPALVGGHLLNPDGTPQKGARRERLTLWRALVSGSGLSRFERTAPIFRDMHRHCDPLPAGVTPVDVVSGALMLMRRSDFLALGGFDEGYFMHVDDIDLCQRVADAGGRVLFQPEACAVHEGATSAASSGFVALQKVRGFRRYFRKNAKSAFERVVAEVGGAALETAVKVRAGLRGDRAARPE